MFKSKLKEQLFEYLRQIIYTPETAALDHTAFPPDERQLAEGLDVLLGFVRENHQFCQELANGNILSVELPARENVMASPLKAIHGTLQHLLWLMHEVAKGDYQQRLFYVNDLSQAFDDMVQALLDFSGRDKLTKLLNQDGFDEKARLLLADATESYSLVTTNINDFKNYNSLYGAEQGDSLLLNVAERLQQLCGEGELCARTQADNFVCLLKVASPEDVLRRFQAEYMEIGPTIGARSYLLRHGIYMIPRPPLEVRAMRRYSDFAALRAQGDVERNFAIFDEKMAAQYTLEHSILSRYEKAKREQEFRVFLQPQVDAQTGKVIACEALARWRNEDGTLLPPASFIDLFESNGLIAQFDFYMTEQVCKYLQFGLDHGIPMVPVAINYSRMHLLDAGFVRHLQAILRWYHIDPRWIEVEITETAFLASQDMMRRMLHELHVAGFCVAMDDFGSGFSSLNFLRSMPLDVIKIDKLFFENFAQDERGRLLVSDILSVVKHLGLQSVAEGVETQPEVDFLRAHGCCRIQGFYYYRPMEAAAVNELLLAQRFHLKGKDAAQKNISDGQLA